MTKPTLPQPPKDFSAWARGVWRELMRENDFMPHEVVTFARALRWFDLADALQLEAEGLSGREKDAKLKAAGDASTTGLRFWRTLRFVDPAKPTRRSGRPPGKPWPPMATGAATLRRLDHADS